MRTPWLMPTLCAASVLLASGCGSSSGGTSNNPPPPSSDILVQNDLFSPVNFSVAAGGTVTWGWDSNGQTHTVTSDDGSTFNSGQKSSGTFEHTFTTAGTFPYHCQIHPTIMKGTITVTAASGDGGSTGGGGTGGGGGGGSGGGGGGGYPYMSGARP